MLFEKTAIEGVMIIRPDVFEDARGYFMESYSEKKWLEAGLDYRFVQDNESKSAKNVLRGLHFQKPPFAQAKIVRVIRGAVMDVAVDLRLGSPTYGQHVSVELSEENKWQFLLPAGMAHGFVTREDNTIFAYKVDSPYAPLSEGCIRWDDPDLGIEWNCPSPILSAKDREGVRFKDFASPFRF
ncbi:MAG: dTDP-4-dehydrorhamnose 3,5-epimerase [Bacteroidales bacterium]|nr:dTDP-4-dehydrorhamnose 3,5-epimerase [Bacteroidales bacterium]MDE7073417.1 dTDP-4-dehydrorhamnose 3,5-epimerase [Bacteroidales bacterium]